MPQGTYILITSDGYRVTPLNDYDSIFDGYMQPDMSRYLNTEKVFEAFGECHVFKTQSEAIEVAQALSKAYQETEDGILVMTDYRKYSFQELKDGKASKSSD
jgi:hypothetical protein